MSRAAGNRAVARMLSSSHEPGCGCAGCARAAAAPAPAPAPAPGTIQRCVYCGNPGCGAGEVCGRSADFEGLFTPGLNTRAVGPYSEARTESQRYVQEAEHMMPAAAWRASGLPHSYGQLPAMGIPYDMHRGGQSGAGGGVTSTGSSHTARGWSQQLGGMLAAGQTREAFQAAATDEYNAALMTGRLNEGVVSQICQTLNLHSQYGHLSAQDAGTIQNAIMDRWLSGR
jgi:hypothetical protein